VVLSMTACILPALVTFDRECNSYDGSQRRLMQLSFS
jgi:hypothetical protein